MKDERLRFKLLANEWDKVKCKGCPRKSRLAHINSLRKELDLQDKILMIKLIKKPLIEESVRNLSWLCIINPNCMFIRNCKCGVGFEEYLKYSKGTPF